MNAIRSATATVPPETPVADPQPVTDGTPTLEDYAYPGGDAVAGDAARLAG